MIWDTDYATGVPARRLGRTLCMLGCAVLFTAALVLLLGVFSVGLFGPGFTSILLSAATMAGAGLVLFGLGTTCIHVARIRELLEAPPSRAIPLARRE